MIVENILLVDVIKGAKKQGEEVNLLNTNTNDDSDGEADATTKPQKGKYRTAYCLYEKFLVTERRFVKTKNLILTTKCVVQKPKKYALFVYVSLTIKKKIARTR